MASNGRKRVVSSCLPCYKKKQKCNRSLPCNHCTQRRRPEDCIYNSSSELPVLTRGGRGRDIPTDLEPVALDIHVPKGPTGALDRHIGSLADLYGHVENSDFSIVGLVQRLGDSRVSAGAQVSAYWRQYTEHKFVKTDALEYAGSKTAETIAPDICDEIEQHFRALPDREVFDFLLDYYTKEVHWIEQVVPIPWLIEQYPPWWNSAPSQTALHVEIGVLFLRVCSYTLLYLPSLSYTMDCVRGIPLLTIRTICDEIAEKLYAICIKLGSKDTIIRVQHLSLQALQHQCEGRLTSYREMLSSVVQVAQRVGLHRGPRAWAASMHYLDKTTWSKSYCNLYIWDSILSMQLDLPCLISGPLPTGLLEQIHPRTVMDNEQGPDDFMGRIMLARLAAFYESNPPIQTIVDDLAVLEMRYENFHTNFLASLPHVFALSPDQGWDDQQPKLSWKRQIFHITIFDCICRDLRAVLSWKRHQHQEFPAHEQRILDSLKRKLAKAAIEVMCNVRKLHFLSGGSYARLAAIILPAFEAAVVLVILLMDPAFLSDDRYSADELHMRDIEPLGGQASHFTRDRCFEAVKHAFNLLDTLANVSRMAMTSKDTLNRLVEKLPISKSA